MTPAPPVLACPLQARERAERERAAREVLQAEEAAAKAAALARSKSERAPSASSPTGAEAPLGALKAPSHIGAYSRPPAPAAVRPVVPKRSTSTGRGMTPASAPVSVAATPAAGAMRGVNLSAPGTPDSVAGAGMAAGQRGTPQSNAWGTPPAGRSGAAAASRLAAAGQPGFAVASPPMDPHESSLGDDSFASDDYAMLERALESSPDGNDAPPPRRHAFSDARPQPLRIPPPPSASTPGAGSARPPISVASTTASHSVPTGRRSGLPQAPSARGVAPNGADNGKAPRTLFTAAIQGLMGLPGAAPLQEAKHAAAEGGGGPRGQGQGQGHLQRLPAAEQLTAEERQLLQSLQRLDAEILRKGLVSAGLIHDATAGAGAGAGAAPSAAPAGRAAARAKAGKAGTSGGGAGAAGKGGVSDSLQQVQLRESLEKLDLKLGALRRKMEGEEGRGEGGSSGLAARACVGRPEELSNFEGVRGRGRRRVCRHMACDGCGVWGAAAGARTLCPTPRVAGMGIGGGAHAACPRRWRAGCLALGCAMCSMTNAWQMHDK